MTRQASIPQHIWETLSTEAQAVVAGVIDQLEQRIADLEERLNQNSTNSSKPPSSDPPSVKRRPPAVPSGKRRGGQPGHRRHTRTLVPPDQVHEAFDCKPSHCRRCGRGLAGFDPQPLRHQVAEIPPVQPVVTEYRLHRLHCPQCGTSTCETWPSGVEDRDGVRRDLRRRRGETIAWHGTVPPQKWMNFSTEMLSRFASAAGLELEV